MASFDPSLAPAIERLRRGDLLGARVVAEAALAATPDQPALLEFAGLMAARSGDPAGAIPHFRRWLSVLPGDRNARVNLATAMISVGKLEEAAELCASADGDPKLLRLAGYACQQLGRLDEAAEAYRAAATIDPTDFESWNNLGNVHTAQGDLDRAINALSRAVNLRPDIIPIYLNLSEVLAQADQPETRQTLMREAARRAPDDAQVHAELGMAESGARDMEAAERAFRTAIALSPATNVAYIELGVLLENLNRVEDLAALLAEAEANGVTGPELAFLRAWILRREGRFEEALPLAEATPETISPIRRAQLIAEVNDRLGNSERAFEAYQEMNAAALATVPVLSGPTYREMVTADAALLTPAQLARWTQVEVELSPPSPAFIIGFPRSGTTLLDTLLMNMPQLHVLEEQPVLWAVEEALGGTTRLAGMTGEETNALRRRYFETLENIQPPPPEAMIVDKFPLHMAQVPLIHRLFPDAKLIFVERHPCDSVLSCFMSNFQLNRAMRSFCFLDETALTYDAVFEAWTRANTSFPLNVHRVRYERMTTDLDSEMRDLLAFLDLPWDDKVLDNRGSAAKRTHIRTASYSQVTEPIYQRSAGRWQRYRRQMEPVLPILEPWVRRMGYEL